MRDEKVWWNAGSPLQKLGEEVTIYTSSVSTNIQEITEESDEPISLLFIGGFILFLLGILLIGFIMYQSQQQSKKSKMTKQQKIKRG